MAGIALYQLCELLDELYPLSLAESWDEPGLIIGDVCGEVQSILYAVDPTPAVIDEAIDGGFDVLITHHPLYFRAVHQVSGYSHRGDMVRKLTQAGCALWVGHTNIDSAYRGTAHAFADQLQLQHMRPLVPAGRTDDAGHELGIGRVGELAQECSFQELVERVARILPRTTLGITAAGDPQAQVRTIATLPGSGDSCFDEVRASGADVYITSDLRHHPALDARLQAEYEAQLTRMGALPAKECDMHAELARPMLINTPHSAIERSAFTYVPDDVARLVEGRWGVRLRSVVSQIVTDPWNIRI